MENVAMAAGGKIAKHGEVWGSFLIYAYIRNYR
jgi:hypothetical protein